MPAKTVPCDFCADPIAAGTLFEHAAFRFRFGRDLMDLPGGSFLGCDTCAQMFKEDRIGELADRAAGKLQASSAMSQRFAVLYRYVQTHLIGTSSVTVADKSARAKRFLAPCAKCGHATVIDASSYEGSKQFACPGCGIERVVIGNEPAESPNAL